MKQTLDNYEEFIEETILKPIAEKEFRIEDWNTRMRDSLDFHDVHIASIRDSLWEAFKAGRKYQFEIQNNK